LLLPFAFVLIPALLAYLFRLVLAAFPAFTERVWSRFLFRSISTPISWITSLLPFSLTELSVVALPFLLLCGLVLLAFALVRRTGRRLAILYTTALVLAGALSVGYAGFMVLHGYNYLREPFAESAGLTVEARSTAELEQATSWLLDQCIALRAQCTEDVSGVTTLPRGIPDTLDGLWKTYYVVGWNYPTLRPYVYARPKPVVLSHYWSYTGIVGMYFPFYCEANLNIDVPEYTIPASAAHEMAHALGYAREDEANFITFLACYVNQAPEVRYSGALLAFTSCWGALSGKDGDASARIGAKVPAGMWRDFAASNAYWKQFAGPVQEASSKTNDAYLKANDQKDGIFSYGRMVDLVLAWYEKTESVSGQ